MKGFQLIATGGALPGRTVTNEELSRTVDTSDAWITSRTGIRTRHWCTADESAATLAIAAAKQALQRSGKTVKLNVPLEVAPDTNREEITISARSPFQGARVANISVLKYLIPNCPALSAPP